MGREVRRVPANWNHPKRNNKYSGKEEYHPAYQGNIDEDLKEFNKDLKKYYKEQKQFDKGKVFKYNNEIYSKENGNRYQDLGGEPPHAPNSAYYMPEGEWYQLFENVSEGTPLSPPFETPEELIDWLSNNLDFWKKQWTREGAEHIVKQGFALSGIMTGGKIYSPEEQYKITQTP